MAAMIRVSWVEMIIVVGLACAAAVTSCARATALDPVVYSYAGQNGYYTSDLWFNGDIPKIVTMMNSRSAKQHSITSEHPLIPAVIFTPAFVMRRVAPDLTSLETIRFMWAALAALWTAALFILLRLVGCHLFDATLFTVLGMISAASVFWYAVPETFSIGSFTIIVVLCLVAWADRARSPWVIYLLINILSLSITVTNWIVGIFATILNMAWRRAVLVMETALLVVMLLMVVEKRIFPAVQLYDRSHRVLEFLYYPEPNRVLEVASSFVSHTVVMPAIAVTKGSKAQLIMTVQQSFPGSGSVLGLFAAATWVALLTLGVWACFSAKRQSRLIWLVGLATATQFALHIVFGGETFLYSMHFLPLLLVIAACVTFTRLRVLGLVLTAIVIISAGINNQWQFLKALEFLDHIAQLATANH